MIKNIISLINKKTIILSIVTFIIVWSDHNWGAIKIFFNIGSNRDFQEKIESIKIFFSSSIIIFFKNLIVCFLITFAVLIALYLLIKIGEFLINKTKNPA